jgi:hypothetical protein
MNKLAFRHLVSFAIVASVTVSLFACGTEKRMKECAAHCQAEAESCSKRKEKDCAERVRKCGEECEKL